jgi:hypothetical protein
VKRARRYDRIIATVLLALVGNVALAARGNDPRLEERDRVRLAEAFRLRDAVAERLWPGWSGTAFAVLLVTPEREFLVRHPRPSDGFTRGGSDEQLGSEVWFRPRQFAMNLLATFPAVGGVPTVVVGQAENTGAPGSTRWVLTLLHEHFHQLQDSQPGIYGEIARLDLARGDETGMWMLNFPFPYGSPAVQQAYARAARALAAALAAQTEELPARVAEYLRERARLGETMGEENYRYFSFQLWKEGVARYTEYRIARLTADNYQPTAAFRGLGDFREFAEVAAAFERRIRTDLETADLAGQQRIAFYSYGAAEALLLDRLRPEWRLEYFAKKFFLESYYPE